MGQLTFRVPRYFSVLLASLEVGLWCAMDDITHTIGSEVGMHFTNLFLFVELEEGAVGDKFAGLLTFAQCFNILHILN